jgi:hypothetical protein
MTPFHTAFEHIRSEDTDLRLRSLVSLSLLITSISACQSTFRLPQSPLGQPFPAVDGQTLTEERQRLPHDLPPEPCILLLGFVQKSQFDIDRWLLGLKQLDYTGCLYEIPAVQGFVPRLLSDRIDAGMREGIPRQEWGNVITVYKDSDELAQFFGNKSPRNARVVLLDSDGTIRFFHDEGYSAGTLLKLIKGYKNLKSLQPANDG